MKILVLADIHGEYQALDRVLDAAGDDYDLLICPGDFTDMFNIPQHFTQLDIANLVVQKLLTLGKPLLCVPGNQDPYEILDIFDEHETNLHGKKTSVAGQTFVGWGGAATPFKTLIEPTEAETTSALNKLAPGLKDFILVVHNPPRDTKLDLAGGKHVGSQAIRDFILKHRPRLAISAHIHESPGEDTLNTTRLFYPGPAYEGNYGIVEITPDKVACERKTVKLT